MRISRLNPYFCVEESPKEQNLDLSLMNGIIEKYKLTKGNIIPLLQAIQEIYGYLPKESFLKLNSDLGLELSAMYGVATFYSQFRLNPVGKHIIKICNGTACHVQNADKLTQALEQHLNIKDGETTFPDKLFTLESVACIGCCSLAPVMMIGKQTYGKLDEKKAIKVITEIKKAE